MSRASNLLEKLTGDEVAHLRKTGGQDRVKDIQNALRKAKALYDDIDYDKKKKRYEITFEAVLTRTDIGIISRTLEDEGFNVTKGVAGAHYIWVEEE